MEKITKMHVFNFKSNARQKSKQNGELNSPRNIIPLNIPQTFRANRVYNWIIKIIKKNEKYLSGSNNDDQHK